MVVATLIFAAGRPRYKVVKPPKDGNILIQLVGIVTTALRERWRSMRWMRKQNRSNGNLNISPTASLLGAGAASNQLMANNSSANHHQHWLDYASPFYPQKKIDDVKAVSGVLFMFLPLPFFWTLFDQQATRWVSQSQKMHSPLINLGFVQFQILPEQMQVMNAIMILILIPVFERGIYPLLSRMGFHLRPLKRMSIGMFITGCTYLMASVLQFQIDKSVIAEHKKCLRSKLC